MDPESGNSTSSCVLLQSRIKQQTSLKAVLLLAYHSFGGVYGDLCISPLYVYQNISGKLRLHINDEEVLGLLSLIVYTAVLVPMMKYILVALNDAENGEGGIFYSLLCQNENSSLLSNQQPSDEELFRNISDEELSGKGRKESLLKTFFDKARRVRIGLLIIVLLGTCMVIGYWVLTPAISVPSAVSGISSSTDHHERIVNVSACIIVVGLFVLQHFGTHKVAIMFAPIVIAWLFCISAIGVYNIFYWNRAIFRALSPYYIYNLLKRTGAEGWISFGSIVLCITGTQSMFADLGHLSPLSLKIAVACIVYPCLILAYMGQAAYLSKNKDDVQWSFYNSIPKHVYWPVFVIAILASVVGSQAVISGTISIIKQCLSLGCFPLVKVIHTSEQIYGQLYLSEVNWMLLLLCLALILGFRDKVLIGLALLTVMFVSAFLVSLVIVIVWRKTMFFSILFLIFFGSIELLCISSSMIKGSEGGWIPLVLAVIFMAVMYTWHYGTTKKYGFDLQNKVSLKWLLTLCPSLGIVRGPGAPTIFSHFATNLSAFVTKVSAIFSQLLMGITEMLWSSSAGSKHRLYDPRIFFPKMHLKLKRHHISDLNVEDAKVAAVFKAFTLD